MKLIISIGTIIVSIGGVATAVGTSSSPSSPLAFLVITSPHQKPHSCVTTPTNNFLPVRITSSCCSPLTTLHEQKSNANTNDNDNNTQENENEETIKIPSIITNTVLKQVYPAMIQHRQQYNNVNIPLGTPDGKKCKTLRRLYAEDKLSKPEIDLLNEMEFRWSSLEDVYEEADFDELLGRLIEYEKEHQNNYQIPKKYPLDPELGAWVTMLRRIGRNNLTPSSRADQLDSINFAWKSTRKCGSSFMKHHRQIREKLQSSSSSSSSSFDDNNDDNDGGEKKGELLNDEEKKWINAQRMVYEKGNLSEARVNYMDQLVGVNWREPL